jgi:hypothetical protein
MIVEEVIRAAAHAGAPWWALLLFLAFVFVVWVLGRIALKALETAGRIGSVHGGPSWPLRRRRGG